MKEHVIYMSQNLPIKENTYSDVERFTIHCYDLFEILLEKLRAIIQRGKTRDYYDVWQIMTQEKLRRQRDMSSIRSVLKEKCNENEIPYEPELMFDENQLKAAKEEWENSLNRLVKNLPEFDKVISDLKAIFHPEIELAEFNKTSDFNPIRNMLRGSDAEVMSIVKTLGMRVIDLLILKLGSKKISEVIHALDVLDTIYSQKQVLMSDVCRLGNIKIKLEELSNDKDDEVKQKAKILLAKLK